MTRANFKVMTRSAPASKKKHNEKKKRPKKGNR